MIWSYLGTLFSLLIALTFGFFNSKDQSIQIPIKSRLIKYHERLDPPAKPLPPSRITLPINITSLYQLEVDCSVGTPKQRVPLVIDTVSPWTWIPSVKCIEGSCTRLKLNAFDQYKSLTYRRLNKRTLPILDYIGVNATVAGRLSRDSFRFGDSNTGKGTFLLVDSINLQAPFLDHGYLGLGIKYQTCPNVPSLQCALFGRFTSRTYSIWIKSFVDQGAVGAISFGARDSSIVDGHSWVRFPSYKPELGTWALKLQNFIVGTEPLNYTARSIVSMATPFVGVPMRIMEQLAKHLKFHHFATRKVHDGNGSIYYTMRCGYWHNAYMPEVTFVIGGHNYTLGARKYLIGNGDDCISIFIGQDMAEDTWILGNSFFTDRMIEFNYDKLSISIANLRQD